MNTTIPRTSRARVEQYTRVGICNGKLCREEKRLKDVGLFRWGDNREPLWRCARCYKAETGHLP